MMNKTKFLAIVAATLCASSALAQSDLDNPDAIMAELQSLSDQCANLEDGQAQTEIFGIQIIRVGDTCAIVNGGELDHRVKAFLEEQDLPWAGVGLWVNEDRSAD